MMHPIAKKYLPYLFIAISFYLGSLSSFRGDERKVRQMYDQDRQALINLINYKTTRISTLNKLGVKLSEKLYKDSVYFADRLKAKDIRIMQLQRRLNEINTTNSTVAELDSIRAVLYGTGK
jgi:hypothetical protein